MGRSRLGLVAFALAAAFVALSGLAGCDAGRPPAAKVGQTEISSDTLMADLEAEAARAEATDSTNSPKGEVDDTWSATASAELLGRRIRYELLGEVLRARDVSVTQEQRDAAEQTLCTGGSTTEVPEGECPGLEGYPSSYRNFQIELAARGNAYQAVLAEEGANQEELQKRYDELVEEDPDQLEVQCYTGATITDPATVQTIQLRVAGGASFADAVAGVEGAEVQGGERCDPASLLPEEVTSAEEGVVLGPYSSQQGGQFVVQIGERRTGTFEEVSPLINQQLATELQEDAVDELLSKADVSVDPRYGHWDRRTGSVVPPTGPTPATQDTAPTES